MSTVKLTISIPDPAKFTQVLNQVRGMGMTVDGVFDILGVVTGSIEQSKVAQLRQVEGIGSAEQERTYTAF